MTISKDGWVEWAIRKDGPPEKVYPEKNASLGIVCPTEGASSALL